MVATWYLISPTYFPQAKNSSIMATTRRRMGIKPQSMGKALYANNKYSCHWEEQDHLIQTPQRCYRHYIENCHQAPPTGRYIYIHNSGPWERYKKTFHPYTLISWYQVFFFLSQFIWLNHRRPCGKHHTSVLYVLHSLFIFIGSWTAFLLDNHLVDNFGIISLRHL